MYIVRSMQKKMKTSKTNKKDTDYEWGMCIQAFVPSFFFLSFFFIYEYEQASYFLFEK